MAHDHISNAVIDELLSVRRRGRFWRNVRFALFIALALTGLGLQIYWSTMYNQDDDFSDQPYASMVSIEGFCKSIGNSTLKPWANQKTC